MPKDEDKAKVKKTPSKFIIDFMSCYTNKLARMKLDPDYVVKMEQKTSDHAHSHAQILVDGNKKLDHEDLAVMGARLMEEQLGMTSGAAEGLIQYGKVKKTTPEQDIEDRRQEKQEKLPRKYMLRRNSPHFQEQFNNCFKQMSYLAKAESGDIIPSDTRGFLFSI